MTTITMNAKGAVRLALRAAALGLVLMLLPEPAKADPCQTGAYEPIPDCVLQQQAPVNYKGWQTSGWAYYCTGDHPYFYGLQQGYIDSYTWDNSCFTVTEDIFVDGPNKLDVTITNWCLKEETITVTLGCSSKPPPGVASCTTVGGPVSDPGCPQSNVKNYCSRGPVPVCFQTYQETCANKTSYFCTMTFGVAYCLQCGSTGSQDQKRASGTLSPVLQALSARR